MAKDKREYLLLVPIKCGEMVKQIEILKNKHAASAISAQPIEEDEEEEGGRL